MTDKIFNGVAWWFVGMMTTVFVLTFAFIMYHIGHESGQKELKLACDMHKQFEYVTYSKKHMFYDCTFRNIGEEK